MAATDAQSHNEDAQSPKRRFAPEEGSVSYALARGLLPLKAVSLSLAIIAALAATAGVLAGDYYRASAGPGVQSLLDLGSSASLGQWLTSSLLLMSGGLCLVVYGLRSSRTDDVRGLYRWWYRAGIALVVCSALYATHAFQIAAEYLAAATGFAPLDGAVWWLAPTVLVTAMLAFRPLADLKESKLSITFAMLAMLTLSASAAAAIGVVPQAFKEQAATASHGGLLLGVVFSATALLGYARRVLLEVDGLIAAPRKKIKEKKPAKESQPAKKEKPAKKDDAPEVKQKPKTAPAPKPTRTVAKTPEKPAPKLAEETRWTDGSDSGGDDYNEDGSRRKLTKAERKRLRKQKAGRYAA